VNVWQCRRRRDAQMWITSYASIHYKPGVPLFDLCAAGRQGRGGRTHLVSPEMAAAAAIEGHFVDIRDWS
jgi:hypothetical protein